MSDVSGTSSTPSGMTGAGGGQLIRITGMASGLDVDAMVKKMLTAEQTKLDKANQTQQLNQWKQESYQSIITEIKNLQSSFFDSTSSDKNILASTNFSPYTVNGGDTSVATFTPGVGAQAGTYSITVNNLAKGASISDVDNTTNPPTYPLSGKTLSTKLTDIDPSLSSSINLVLNAGGSNINITLNNSGNSTIGDLVNAINNQSSGSVKASFSELTGEFKLVTSTTGSNANLTIKSGTTDLSKILGSYPLDTAINGTDASVTITPPGASSGTTVTKSSNSFTIDGMSYTLSSAGTTSVNVSTDSQNVYDKITSFINQYNTIVDDIQSKLTDKPDPNYQPLTDSQKSQMTSSQISAWEAKAQVGILRNDTNLQNLLNDLRSSFTTAVSGTGLSIGTYGSNTFGIDTSSDYTKPGHIDIVNPTKLKDAITNSPDQILKIFTNISTATDGSKNYTTNTQEFNGDGIFTRINSILQKNVGFTNTTLNSAVLTSYANVQYDYSITGTAGKGTIPDQIYEQQLMIKKITDEMSTQQEKYYQQFSQLDTMMSQLNSQQSQLTSMLGG